MSTTDPAAARFHALDSVRAWMMLLGIVVHTATSYCVTPIDAVWKFKDPQPSMLFDLLLVFIHTFRMPVFYVVAGFFGRLLLERIGVGGFARHRLRRVLVPMLVFWPLLFVTSVGGQIYAAQLSTGRPWDALVEQFRSGGFLAHLGPVHLWFLYYLLMYALVVVAAVPLVKRFGGHTLTDPIERLFRRCLDSPFRALIFTVPTALALYRMSSGGLDTPLSWIPDSGPLLAYALFFGFGWLLYGQKETLDGFARHAWKQVGLAVVIIPVNVHFSLQTFKALPERLAVPHLISIVTCALMMWLLIFGVIGLFVRYTSQPSARARYVSDASYWMYLMHLPLVIWFAVLAGAIPIPGVVKAAVIIPLATAILLVTYETAVRYTFVGAMLNGRKFREPRVAAQTASSPG